jgi:hypothetical protein
LKEKGRKTENKGKMELKRVKQMQKGEEKPRRVHEE